MYLWAPMDVFRVDVIFPLFPHSISRNQQVPRGLAWLRDTFPASGRTFPIHIGA